MSPNTPPQVGSFLDRFHALRLRSPLVATPLALVAAVCAPAEAGAADITVDYAAVTAYSNSGFFTGFFLDQASVTGSATGTTAQLVGTKTTQDSALFWRYDSLSEQTAPRYDTTGLVFFFGGTLPAGIRTEDDRLEVSYSFSIVYNHTVANINDVPSVSTYVEAGHSDTPYTLSPAYPQEPQGVNSQNSYGGFYDETAASPITVTGSLSVSFPSWTGVNSDYWYAYAAVNFDHEFVSSNNWDGANYSKYNGDELSVIIPNAGFTVTYTTPAPIPEPAQAASALAGLAAVVVLARRRRRGGA